MWRRRRRRRSRRPVLRRRRRGAEEEEEEDLGVPVVWQRGPSRLPDRPIPLEHRLVL